MSSVKDLANHLAKYGRNGDSKLVHMHPLEITALEALTGKKATTNPVTGQTEAFAFLIPLLTALLSVGAATASSVISNKLSNKKAVPDESAAGKYLAARGTEDKAQWKIPIVQYGQAPQKPEGYVPGISPEYLQRPGIQSILGSVDLNGKTSPWQPGFAEGGQIPEQGQAEELYKAAAMVLLGQSNDQAAIQKFIAVYGEDKLQELAAQIQQMQGGGQQMPQQAPMQADMGQDGMARGGLLRGPGGGMDDLLRARVAGGQPVALSGGEEIIPADVVGHLGDGSTEAGHRVLRSMVNRIRQQKTGRTQQPGKINHARVMPA